MIYVYIYTYIDVKGDRYIPQHHAGHAYGVWELHFLPYGGNVH